MTFESFAGNPVFGNPSMGTAFDAYTVWDGSRYRMDFSYRRKKSLAVTFSADGIHWQEPVLTLEPNAASGWEENINRNCVLRLDGIYKMWYTGQADNRSCIGYAESTDGIHFVRKQAEPVMVPDCPWEKESVMNPCVLYENGVYRMWYSGGETYEPNANGYAESADGIHWEKHRENPVFTCAPENFYEQERVGGCQVLRTEDMGYLMFYIGYEDIDTARICVARSEDGITNWVRSKKNPLVEPEAGTWNADACYKPTAIWEEADAKWRIWYNGRRGTDEFIGLAEYKTRNLF